MIKDYSSYQKQVGLSGFLNTIGNFKFIYKSWNEINVQVNNVLEGRPPSDQKEYYDMTIGQVTHILNKNYGVICFDKVSSKQVFN